jgi:hypothetical protein
MDPGLAKMLDHVRFYVLKALELRSKCPVEDVLAFVFCCKLYQKYNSLQSLWVKKTSGSSYAVKLGAHQRGGRLLHFAE